MLSQCWALILLKFTLSRNTWSSGKWAAVLVGAVLLILGLALALGLSVVMYMAGAHWLYGQDPLLVLGVLDGLVAIFVFFGWWGLLIELQRADVIDFRKMLFFPISLGAVFSLNFLASLLSPGLLFFLPCAVGLIAGFAAGYGPRMGLAAPLAAAFFLMLAAWAYYVRGMLAILMENKRRRRFIMTVLPLCFVLLGQIPSIAVHALKTHDGKSPSEGQIADPKIADALYYGNLVIPLGWLPFGMTALIENQTASAAFALLGLGGLTALGLGLGYRSTRRHYTGAGRTAGIRARATTAKPAGVAITARRIPLLDEETSTLTLAAFANYLRHPNIRILLIMPVCMGLLILFINRSGVHEELAMTSHPWLPVMILVWPFFNFSLILFNVFGIDRNGFRGLVLLPTPRYKFLLAKNIALFPFVAGLSLAFVFAGALLLDTAPRLVAISVLQVFQLYLMYCLVGNFTSIYFPYRLGRDTMRARSNRAVMMLLGLVSAAVVAILLAPAAFCMMLDDLAAARWGYHGWPIGLIVSAVWLLATVFAYVFALRHAGDLLLAREQDLIAVLTRDNE